MNYNEAKFNYLILFNELKDIDEDLIATNVWYSYTYARDILKGRFILSEDAIAREHFYKLQYNSFLKEQGINFQL